MLKRSVAAVLVLVFFFTGCHVHTVQKLPVAQVPATTKDMIVGVTLATGEQVSFDKPGGTLKDGVVHGVVAKAPYEKPIGDVQRLWVQHDSISTGRTIGLVAGITVGTIVVLAAIVAATKQSCPFIYSWDGSKYVFDAEPYGGAIAHGLEKDDYTELGQLRADDGRYKLRMTNEVDETQMTNLTELWVVDHPAGARVVPDIEGKLRTISAPQELLSASDATGKDLLPWLRSTDQLIWEPSSIRDANGSLTGDITMTFPKPANAREAKLVVNAATGLWGSYMIKKMVALRGRDLNKFYLAVNHSKTARTKLHDWEVREELYALKVYVDEPTGWQVRGILPGTGPFISKDRILPLDVSHVLGNRLRIRIHPPAGFWAMNSFAADYTPDQPISVQTVKATAARNADGTDALRELAAADGRYLSMPFIGDQTDISFPVPAQKSGLDRAVFLHSRGYYKLHLDGTGEPDKRALEAFEKEPGSALQFAAAQFQQWQHPDTAIGSQAAR